MKAFKTLVLLLGVGVVIAIGGCDDDEPETIQDIINTPAAAEADEVDGERLTRAHKDLKRATEEANQEVANLLIRIEKEHADELKELRADLKAAQTRAALAKQDAAAAKAEAAAAKAEAERLRTQLAKADTTNNNNIDLTEPVREIVAMEFDAQANYFRLRFANVGNPSLKYLVEEMGLSTFLHDASYVDAHVFSSEEGGEYVVVFGYDNGTALPHGIRVEGNSILAVDNKFVIVANSDYDDSELILSVHDLLRRHDLVE